MFQSSRNLFGLALTRVKGARIPKDLTGISLRSGLAASPGQCQSWVLLLDEQTFAILSSVVHSECNQEQDYSFVAH